MRKFFIVFLTVFLTACGTVSDVHHHPSNKSKEFLDYNTIVIGEIKNSSKGKLNDRDFQIIKTKFANLLTEKINESQAFVVASKENLKGKAIIISGSINEHDQGDSTARFMIGFGAGSSYFKADIKFSDSANNKKLGHIDIDLNSGLLGGVIGASYDADALMVAAATSVADSLIKTKSND